MNHKELLESLKITTNQCIAIVEQFKALPKSKLQAKKESEAWSALDCIEHLNRYSAFYLPEIAGVLAKAKPKPKRIFKSGILGNYFAKAMQVRPKLNKMKTFKKMNPTYSTLSEDVLDVFLTDQKALLRILDKAEAYDLTSLKTNISISKFIKIRLGDTLRIVVYHTERHIQQAIQASNLRESVVLL